MAVDSVETKVKPILDTGQQTAEFGVPVDLPFQAYNTDGTVINPAPVSVKELAKMRKHDGQVRALMRVISLPVRSALRSIAFVPADGGEAEAEFVEQMFTLPSQAGGMTVSLEKLFSQILLALTDGFTAFEQVYQVPAVGELMGKVTLRKLAIRPSTSITFIADNHGGFSALRQKTTFQGKDVDVVIPAKDAFYYAAAEEENPFYGMSYFTPAFYHYDKKIKLYYVTHLAAQHHSVPGRTGKMPPNATQAQKAAFQASLGNFGVTGAMTFPEGFEVDELRGSGAGAFPYMDIINHHNQQMSKSVLAQFIDRNDEKAMVDFSETDTSLFVMSLQTIADEICGNFNTHLIPKFVDWNFGSGKYPEMKLTVNGAETEKAIKEMFTDLSTAAQLNASPDFLHELEKQLAEKLGLDLDYEGELDDEFAERKTLEAKKAELEAEPPPVPMLNPGAPFSNPGANTLSLSDIANQIISDLDSDDS